MIRIFNKKLNGSSPKTEDFHNKEDVFLSFRRRRNRMQRATNEKSLVRLLLRRSNEKTETIKIMFTTQKGFHSYYVYILTNSYRSTFCIGVTNNLKLRLQQHKDNLKTDNKTFASKYCLEFLVYYEKFVWIQEAISREKELKKWRREKKIGLIKEFNPKIEFLNYQFDSI